MSVRTTASETLKTITITKLTVLLNEDTTSEKTVVAYAVDVQVPTTNSNSTFQTLEEAQAYAADVATRELRPFNFARMLEPR